jgi:hypothetical protein
MNTVFLDTVGLLALWDVADQWHMPAEEAFAEIMEARQALVTSTTTDTSNLPGSRFSSDRPFGLRRQGQGREWRLGLQTHLRRRSRV